MLSATVSYCACASVKRLTKGDWSLSSISWLHNSIHTAKEQQHLTVLFSFNFIVVISLVSFHSRTHDQIPESEIDFLPSGTQADRHELSTHHLI